MTDTTPTAPTPDAPVAPNEALPPAAVAPFNVLAIVSIVSAFLVALVGIITGHIALSQIKKRGERGRGVALAGTIIGYVNLVVSSIVITLIILATVATANAVKDSIGKDGLDALGAVSGDTSTVIGGCFAFSKTIVSEQEELVNDFTLMSEDPAAASESLARLSATFYDTAAGIDNSEVQAIAFSLAQNTETLGYAIGDGTDGTPALEGIISDMENFTTTCTFE